ncbi:MAG: hypothetical protein JXA15_07440 [Spirochaetales bacterium]|nr:hypothetical protein [Spirochaetales bacterium]
MRRTPIKVRYLVSIMCAGAALVSCAGGPYSGSVPLEKALSDGSLDADTLGFLEAAASIADFLAARFGLEKGVEAIRFISQPRQGMAWRLVAVEDGVPANARTTWHTSLAEAESAAAKLGERATYMIEEVAHISGTGRGPGPLVSAHMNLSRTALVEEVVFRVLYEALDRKRSVEESEREALALFLAEKATQLYLVEKLSPASPVLGNYIAQKRDERTFQTLLGGLRERFANVLSQDLPAAETERSLSFQTDVWLEDFRFNYSRRFLGDGFQAFGSDGVSAALLAANDDPIPSYAELEAEYRRLGEDPVAFFGSLSSGGN